MTSEAEQREREARDLRVEISRLNESRKTLEGLVLVPAGAWARQALAETEAAITEKSSRLFDLMPGTDGKGDRMTDVEIRDKVEELKTEARGLQDALRPLVAIEALGEDLLTDDERDRKGRVEARLREIRGEADDLAERKRANAAERRRAAKQAEERKQDDDEGRRRNAEIRLSLWTRITEARRERIAPQVGINAAGQPPGHSVIVDLAGRVEEMLAVQFDAEAGRVFGLKAVEVRSHQDDASFGIHLEPETGEIQAGPPPPPTAHLPADFREAGPVESLLSPLQF